MAMKIAVAIFILLLAVLLVGYRMHSRVVTSGEFYGLSIGSSKAEVVRLLREKPITAVSIYNIREASINKSRINQIDSLANYGGIRVRGAGSLDEIFVSDGVVERVQNVYGNSMVSEISPGQSFEEIRGFLRDLAQTSGQVTISVFTRGYGAELSRVSVDLRNANREAVQEGIDWLMQQDVWTFNTEEGHTRFILIFRDETLREIDYKNYFIELP